ncbi:MAG TPA: 5-formyltetrahydrofolate cyclo-ligase [Jatrophihabitans sp.]|nr:5-formyltetrahydrofolate cyclo-ligase [Jatrophihabitans sp.]
MTTKTALRQQLRQQRRARSAPDRNTARAAIRGHVLAHIDTLTLPAGSTVAGYEPLATEPGSVELLDALANRDLTVLVPITLADKDLAWRHYRSEQALPPSAIQQAALILLPALAVDRAGNRLGRGGGSYDRALRRASPTALTAALLFADELLASVPTEQWDQPVQAVVTPDGWLDLPLRVPPEAGGDGDAAG